MHSQLRLLQLYAQLRGLPFDPEQLQHQCDPLFEGPSSTAKGRVLQALQLMGFDACIRQGSVQQALMITMPALMPTHGDSLMLVGRNIVTTEKTDPSPPASLVVQIEGQEAQLLDEARFAQLYAGHWIEAAPAAQGRATADHEAAAERFGLA